MSNTKSRILFSACHMFMIVSLPITKFGILFFAGQMFLMDRFFDGTFLTFGIEVISFAERDQEDRIDPMVYIFPRMTKCTFHKFGSSGEIEKHDAMCILPLNIVNEKIYIFIWFWMLLLCALTTMVLIYRIFIIFSPRMRAYLLYIRFRLVKKECINIINYCLVRQHLEGVYLLAILNWHHRQLIRGSLYPNNINYEKSFVSLFIFKIIILLLYSIWQQL